MLLVLFMLLAMTGELSNLISQLTKQNFKGGYLSGYPPFLYLRIYLLHDGIQIF